MQNNESYGIVGRNFTGRSYFLKKNADEKNLTQTKLSGIYLRPNARESLSSLSETVYDELMLHYRSKNSIKKDTQSIIKNFISETPLKNLLYRNPQTLSGGELSILAIISKLLLLPEYIGIDGLLEQLDKELKLKFLGFLGNELASDMDILIVDNRLKEQNYFPIKSLPNYTEKEKFDTIYTFCDITSKYQIPFINFEPVNLKVKGLSFEYEKGNKILNDINFELEPGNIYHLQGKNGVGKTTLSKILAGLLKYSNGELLVNNTKFNPYKHPGKVVSYSYQDPDVQIFNPKSVENELIQTNKKLVETSKDRLDSILCNFGLSKLSKVNPFDLPLTIRKRIAIAGSLYNPRPVYIFDEPTLWQDDFNSYEIAEIFKSLTIIGIIVVVISHSEYFCNLLSAKKLHIIDGKFQ